MKRTLICSLLAALVLAAGDSSAQAVKISSGPIVPFEGVGMASKNAQVKGANSITLYATAFLGEPGDIGTAVTRLIDRYEAMGDANVRMLELEGRVPAIDHLLEVSRAGHRAWIERTLLPDRTSGDHEQVVLALYAATDVTVWKLLRRDLGQTRPATEAVILRLVRAVLDGTPTGKDRRS